MSLIKLFKEHGVTIPSSITEEQLNKAILAEIAERENEKLAAIELCRKKELAILHSAMERITANIKFDLQKRDLLNGTNITFKAEFGQYGLKVTCVGNSILTGKVYYVNSDGIVSDKQETCELPYDFRQARKA